MKEGKMEMEWLGKSFNMSHLKCKMFKIRAIFFWKEKTIFGFVDWKYASSSLLSTFCSSTMSAQLNFNQKKNDDNVCECVCQKCRKSCFFRTSCSHQNLVFFSFLEIRVSNFWTKKIGFLDWKCVSRGGRHKRYN